MTNKSVQLHENYAKWLAAGVFTVMVLSIFFIARQFGWDFPIFRQYTEDTVYLEQAPKAETGILVDGVFQKDAKSPAIFKNDKGFTSKSMPIPIGHVDKASGKNNEIVAFAQDRPVLLKEKVTWSNAYDDIKLTFRSKPFSIPISLWILFDKDKDSKIGAEKKALTGAILQTNTSWKQENMGLKLVAAGSDFHNALPSMNSKSSGYTKFSCGNNFATLKTDIGFVKGRVNIYMVDEVMVGTTYAKYHGQTCVVGSDIIVVGSAFQATLLTHELGHSLNLYHPPTSWMKSADRTVEKPKKNKLSIYNALVPDSYSHKYFTEGQVFRAHVNPDSALNDIYTERSKLGSTKGYPTRATCTKDNADFKCPDLDRRLWANGAFYPSN